jgi:hypothetical protein
MICLCYTFDLARCKIILNVKQHIFQIYTYMLAISKFFEAFRSYSTESSVERGSIMMPGIASFFGVSSIEILPTERAIRSQVEPFNVL